MGSSDVRDNIVILFTVIFSVLADIKTIYNNDNNVFLLWFAFLFLQVRSAFKRMRQRQLLSRGSDNVSMFIGSVSCII